MSYYVYILASNTRVLYVGFTNNLQRRIHEHKHHLIQGYTSRYNVDRLVYFEQCQSVWDAIAREKQLKGWSRAKKVALIDAMNPAWDDLSGSWDDGN